MGDVDVESEGSGPKARARVRVRCLVTGTVITKLHFELQFNSDESDGRY